MDKGNKMKKWTTQFRYWLISILLILAAALFWYIRDLITPLIIAALLTYILNPLVIFFTKKFKFSRSLAVSFALILTILIISLLPIFTIPTLISELEILSTDLLHVLSDFQEFISKPIEIAGQVFDLSDMTPDYVEMLSSSFLSISENAIHIIENITRNLILILLVLSTTFYLLRDWTILRNWVYDRIPIEVQNDFKKMYVEIREIWAGYVRGNLFLMAIVGVAFTIAWVLIGVPGALILGIITGILTIIPDLGPAIAVGLAMIVALVEGSLVLDVSNIWFAVIVLVIYLVLINIKAIWIRPKVFGKSVHMHEGIVFAVIIIAVIVQGILGALIIIPLIASANVLFRYIYSNLFNLPKEKGGK